MSNPVEELAAELPSIVKLEQNEQTMELAYLGMAYRMMSVSTKYLQDAKSSHKVCRSGDRSAE